MAHCEYSMRVVACENTYSNRASGFSIIEVMIVLVIASILVAAAGPGFQDLMGNNRALSEVYTLRATLNHARSEALARRAPVVVCPTRDGLACADTDDWSTGYMVFVDTDNNNIADQNDPDEEIIQFETGPRSVDLAFNNGNRRVRFGAQGVALGFEGTFTFCDERGVKNARGLIINPVGTLAAATDTDDPEDLIVDDAGGDNVTCAE
ncbi:MAG: GspH/FimT family pseudopilin [Halioglobus sp.]|nr:GspH/FimT family pseudopilin [Halioglobus sp.]